MVYSGEGSLMPNYGWVQNTSNLSTVRDTVDLLPEEGLNHKALMRAILDTRLSPEDRGNDRRAQRLAWDARCRIKAICACGMARLDRDNQGYRLTELGRELRRARKHFREFRGLRLLSSEEIELFRQGILTNPPVVRVLTLLNESRKKGREGLSKYDIGGRLGFAGDVGFTHYEPEFVVRMGKSFINTEGDADKWARTILSWLTQVGWVARGGTVSVLGRPLWLYTTDCAVDRVLRYSARSAIQYIPQEMLCSHRHPFAEIVQRRRVSILRVLEKTPLITFDDLLSAVLSAGDDTDAETLEFDLLNLQQAGIPISRERSHLRLTGRIKLDAAAQPPLDGRRKVDGIEKLIEHYVAKYADTLPSRLVDSLIRHGCGGTASAALFETSVEKFFSLMGYESQGLGQGRGRVADVIAKYRGPVYPKSYGLIIDAKAYEKYAFPAGDVRKMKEYIGRHGQELLNDQIPNHAFVFVSMAFSAPEGRLEEIAGDTAVNGTAIDVFTLLELGSRIARGQLSIAGLYPSFATNRLFVCP